MSTQWTGTDLVSGEGVAFELRRADVGSRLVAGAVDIIGQFVAIVLWLWFVGAQISSEAAFVAAAIAGVVAVFFAYPLLMEWRTRGRTLGKMAMGLRAVRDDGGPLGFRQALVRALSAFILEKPGLLFPLGTAVGVLTMLINPEAKRLGDLMAGTFVMNERSGSRRHLEPVHFPISPALQAWAASADLSGVDDRLAATVRQFLARAPQLTPQAVYGLGNQLAAQVVRVISPPPPWTPPAPELLSAVLGERRRRADLAAGGVSPVAGWPPDPAGLPPAGLPPAGPVPPGPVPTRHVRPGHGQHGAPAQKHPEQQHPDQRCNDDSPPPGAGGGYALPG